MVHTGHQEAKFRDGVIAQRLTVKQVHRNWQWAELCQWTPRLGLEPTTDTLAAVGSIDMLTTSTWQQWSYVQQASCCWGSDAGLWQAAAAVRNSDMAEACSLHWGEPALQVSAFPGSACLLASSIAHLLFPACAHQPVNPAGKSPLAVLKVLAATLTERAPKVVCMCGWLQVYFSIACALLERRYQLPMGRSFLAWTIRPWVLPSMQAQLTTPLDML
jgi:hypothetical protein